MAGVAGRIKLGELLVRANLLSEPQLKTALAEQGKWGGKIGEILVRMSYITEDVLVKALAKQLGLPRADLEHVSAIPRAVLNRVPSVVARDCSVIPLAVGDDGKSLVVAMSDPLNIKILDELRSVTRGARIIAQIAGVTAIARAIARLYEGEESLDDSSGGDGGFKMVDSQGRTIIKTLAQIEKEGKAPRAAVGPGVRPAAPAPAPAPPPPPAAAAPAASGSSATLQRLEEQQSRELQAMKALVEILIDKGVFSRDEYMSRIRR